MKINYDDYIKSQEWDKKRRQKLNDAGFLCEKCSKNDMTLDVHHLSYARLGAELMSDLIVLCRYCHKVAHGMKTAEQLLEEWAQEWRDKWIKNGGSPDASMKEIAQWIGDSTK